MLGIILKVLSRLSYTKVLGSLFYYIASFAVRRFGLSSFSLIAATVTCAVAAVPVYTVWLILMSSMSALGLTIAALGVTPSLSTNELLQFNHYTHGAENAFRTLPIETVAQSTGSNTGYWIGAFTAVALMIATTITIYNVVFVGQYNYPSFSEILFGVHKDYDVNNPAAQEQLQTDLATIANVKDRVDPNSLFEKLKLGEAERIVQQTGNPVTLRLDPRVRDYLPPISANMELYLKSINKAGLIEKVATIPNQIVDSVVTAAVGQVSETAKVLTRGLTKTIMYGTFGVTMLGMAPVLGSAALSATGPLLTFGGQGTFVILRAITSVFFSTKFPWSSLLKVSADDKDNPEQLVDELVELESKFTKEELLTGTWEELIRKCADIAKEIS